MEIKAKVVKTEYENSRIVGFAQVTIDDCFVVKGIRIKKSIKEGGNELFLEMPKRENRDGEKIDIAHPINQGTRKMFEDVIFEEYYKLD